MPEVIEVKSESKVESTAAVTDRRRPGRMQNVSPELVSLLREQEPSIVFEAEEVDQNSAFRGVCIGVLLSAPFWALIAYAGSLTLSR